MLFLNSTIPSVKANLGEYSVKVKNGNEVDVLMDKNFIRIFNILADKPETVAKFFIPKMLKIKNLNFRIKRFKALKVKRINK